MLRLVKDWLQDRGNGQWLMIIDNVDNDDVIFEKDEDKNTTPAGLKLLTCIPKVEHGLVLFTSRYKRLAARLTSQLVELHEMPDEEARELLKGHLVDQHFDAKDAELLLEELGHIPLAITHAAAFMRQNSMAISEYLELYRESEEERIELLEASFEDLSLADMDVPKPVLTAWTMSFSSIKSDGTAGALASDLVSVMSFLDRQEIPKSLLLSFCPKYSKVQYAKAFGTLKAFSLVSESADIKTFSMHRLVQLSMRKWLKQQDTDRKFAAEAIELLANNFPDGSFKTWKECSELVIHADTVLGLATESGSVVTRTRLLTNVAMFQSNRGQYAAAETKFAEAVKLRAESLGEDNLETLQAMDSLALVMRHQAKYEAAEDLAQQTLLKKEKLFGKEHANTLKTAHIVATLLRDRGTRPVLAEQQNRQILEARTKTLGPDDLDTLESASGLALSLWELGRFEEAEGIARDVLSAREKALGEEHPDTLDTAGTLGFILEVRGKYAEAEELKRHMLQIRERVLGDAHPDTADSLHDVGWIIHQQGYYLEAEEYYDRALRSKLKLLGEDHPKTLTTLCNLPVLYCDKGDYEEAEKASKRIIADFERVEGLENPRTLDALGGLAVILRHQAKLEAAAQAAQRSISGREKVIGKDHPWTLPPVSHYGYIKTLQGQKSAGEKIIRTALAGLESSLGKDHPYVLTSVVFLSKNLAQQDDASKHEESEALARRALDARTRALGPDHPYTYKTMYHTANVLFRRKKYEEAETTCRKALDGLQKTLGTEHPDVINCERDYAKIIDQVALHGHSGTEQVDEAVVIDLTGDRRGN